MRVLGLCNFSLDRDHVSYQLMFSLNVANAGTNKYLVLAWLTREYHKPIINHNKIPTNFEYKFLLCFIKLISFMLLLTDSWVR